MFSRSKSSTKPGKKARLGAGGLESLPQPVLTQLLPAPENGPTCPMPRLQPGRVQSLEGSPQAAAQHCPLPEPEPPPQEESGAGEM